MPIQVLARRWCTCLAGVALGAVTAVADLLFFLLAPARGTVALTGTELRRITRFHGSVLTDPLTAPRCRRYLGLRWTVGFLGGGVVLLFLLLLVTGLSVVTAWIFDGDWALVSDEGRVGAGLVALGAVPGLLLLFVTGAGVVGVGALDRWAAVQILGRDTERALRARVAELTTSRDDVVDAVDAERRRIERDLHDGLQQRLVALGMLVGRARRSPDRAGDLLEQAHAAAQEAVADLREVAYRVHPNPAGLAPALSSLAERAAVPVSVRYELTHPLRPAVETVLFHVVSEAITNVAKHAGATAIEVVVAPQAHERVRVVIVDDGRGGADPSGSGLVGLSRRVAAVDGTATVHSPPGGPTTLEVSVPCG